MGLEFPITFEVGVTGGSAMELKQAITLAHEAVGNLFGVEGARDLAFEEMERDDTAGLWSITISFSRPRMPLNPSILGNLATLPVVRREFKVVSIRDTGEILSIKNRPGFE